MTRITNLRQIDTDDGPYMVGDFTAPDGRVGSVSVPLEMFRAHGEAALLPEADACVRQAQRHGYRPPEEDRFRELS